MNIASPDNVVLRENYILENKSAASQLNGTKLACGIASIARKGNN
jgi:hypothetical protein